MSARRLLIVLSAPSGGGKTTIAEALLRADRGLARSISATTRAPRGQEQDGRDYYFISDSQFSLWVSEKRFLESARVHGFRYGTLRSEVDRLHRRGLDAILVIDVQGGLQVKRRYPEAVLIFVQPPSLKVLAQRLKGRGTDNASTIRARLANARGEISLASRYDYSVNNVSLEDAVAQVNAIITAERLRVVLPCRRGQKPGRK